MTNNAFAQDYSQQAKAAGLPGANDDAARQTMLGRVVQGPRWTRQEYEDAMKQMDWNRVQDRANKTETDRNTLENKTETDRNTLEKQRLDEDRTYHAGQLGVEGKRAEEEHADREDRSRTAGAAQSEQALRDKAADEDRKAENERRSRLTDAQVQAENDRDAAEKKRAAMMDYIMKGGKGEPPSSTDTSAAPNNQSATNPDVQAAPTVPGSSPGFPPSGWNIGSGNYNDLLRTPVQPSGSPQTQNPGTGPVGATPGQQGQAPGNYGNGVAGTPPLTLDMNALTSPQNQLVQGVGQQAGSPLTGIPAHPLGMTGGATSASGYVPPFQFDPRVMQAVYALARAKGWPGGVGGTPMGAGGGAQGMMA
jgi:hypothetical protein